MRKENRKEFFRRLRLLNKSFIALELQVIQLTNLNEEIKNRTNQNDKFI